MLPEPPPTTVSPPSLEELPRPIAGWRKALLMVGAGVTLVLGVLGVVLPGLPATPFLLITSYCLLRTSPRLHRRLLNSPILGGLLRDWQRHRGIRRGHKVRSLVVIALVLGLTLWLSPLSPVGKGVVIGLAVVGMAIVARLPEVAPEG